jgi:hypothetical protein
MDEDDIDDERSQDASQGDGVEEDRAAQVRSALLKALAVVIVIGAVIALGTTIVVHALGLSDNDSSGPVGAGSSGPNAALPTTALPVPGKKSETAEPTPEPSASASTDPADTGKIQLDVSPVKVQPNERVNLTGKYPGADNVGLQVQRFQDGTWQDFGVDVTVRLGTYATYIQTGRPGEQRFRIYDPAAKESSNVVLVTIG